MKGLVHAGRALSAVVLASATWLVVRTGRVAAVPLPPPSEPAAASGAARAEEIERAELLVDRLDDARWVVPGLAAALPGFRKASWRTLRAPYLHLRAPADGAVHVVALMTSETEKARPAGEPGGLRADDRTWNLAEASFDAREAILAPPPATIAFPLRVPAHARLSVAPTVLALHAGSVTFEVAVRENGARTVVDTLKITAAEPPSWHERRVALDAWSGRDVELELATTTSFVGDPPAALWGAPALIGQGPAPVPYSVLWVVIDTMRPDALASWHDEARDAARAKAPLAPLDAWLPAMASVVPNLDALARRGVSFTDATSAATWTRPGTLALLAGARSSELGLDTTPWILPAQTIARFYASDPPLVPVLLRRAGVRGGGFVNNFFLTGYARAGIDPGLPELVDHRDATLDTDRIVRDALRFLDERKGERFFAFVNLNSPHNPYEPAPRYVARVPKPPLGPKDPIVRAYLGEIAKDDEAVGRLVAKLDELHLRERTLVVVTADHGETLSIEHDVRVDGIGEGAGTTRFRHANAMWDETVRVPIVMSLPGALPEGRRVDALVSTTDVAPTILELLALPRPGAMRGRSLLSLVAGGPGDPERAIVSEGRGARAIRVGSLRYVERDPNADHLASEQSGLRVAREELFDLATDPGERRDVARERSADLARMRERLGEALSTSTAADARGSAALAGSRHLPAELGAPGRVRLRFVGGGIARRFSLSARVVEADTGARLSARVVELDPAALRCDGRTLDLALVSVPDGIVGVDVELVPASARLSWEVRLDDALLAPARFFAGPFGLAAARLARGIVDAETVQATSSRELAAIDPLRDLGVFVTRDPGAGAADSVDEASEAAGEMKRLLEAWGYAKTR